MKNTLKLASLAIAAMALMVACKNAPEATEDTTPIDTTPIEEIVEDTMPAIDTVEVAPAEPAKPAAKPAKKATTKKAESENISVKQVENNGSDITISTSTAKRPSKGDLKLNMDKNNQSQGLKTKKAIE